MFNLIMRSVDWGIDRQQTIVLERIFKYTDGHIEEQFKQNGNLLFDRLRALPCLFMPEGIRDEIAYVGQINKARVVGGGVLLEFTLDADVPPLRNSTIYANRLNSTCPLTLSFRSTIGR